MRATLLLFINTTILSLLGLGSSAFAQEYTSTGYYYNNFDGNQLGTKLTAFGGAAFTIANTNLALGDGYSLSSTKAGVAGGYQFSFIPAGTNLNNEQFGYEWTMLYKNSGGNPDDSKVIDNGENSWKYWLFANNTNLSDMQGYYLTQIGENLELRLRVNSNDRQLISFKLSDIGGNNKTYAIRVQRIKRGTQFVWQLFVDEYTAVKKEASTPRGRLNYEAGIFSIYNYSGLAASSTTNGRFRFDELKLYSMQLSISGANEATYGVSNPLYPGLQNAVIYGLKVETRGYFDIYQMVISLSGNINGVADGTMKLNKSKDAYFGNADDSFVANMSYYDTAIQNYSISDSFYSTGEEDGSLALAFYYFLTVNIKSSPTSGATFAISGAPELNGSSSQANYSNTSSVVNVATTPTNTGNTRDWVGGTSSDWSNAANWSPTGVPGANDLACIGVSTFINQPTVNTNTFVGNIVFGAVKAATLSISSGAALTVNNNIEDTKGATIAGSGTLTVKGTYFAKPTASADGITTASISNFNTSNFVLNTKDKAVTFNVNSNQTTVTNSIQSSGVKTATLTLASSATLTLNGANPSDFKATTNAVILSNGSTVVYNANVPQTVNTLVPYKNIIFSGTGIKKIAAGTLTVLGNWTSSGGKVDLLANDTEVVFDGVAQSITDLGSDAGNGIVFKNVKFSGGGNKTLSATGKFAVAVGSYLTMSANTILQTGDNLTFKASALGSASVSAIPTNSSIKGQVTVEKYIQGGSKEMWRTNRMLSSPVYDNTTNFINANGGRTYSFTQFIDDIIITGKGGAANGFDSNMGNAASAWTYVSGKSFVEIPNITTSLNVGMGAYLFYRGDRSDPTAKVTAPFVDAESIVMTFKGTLNQQDITVPLAAANLLGNPYAATIDWNAVTKTNNLGKALRVWNPKNRQYATYNGEYGINDGTRYIGPGQAFFIQATGTTASVTFTEASKISDVRQERPLYNTTMAVNDKNISSEIDGVTISDFNQEQPFTIRAKLAKVNAENSDETLIVLKNGELATVAGDDVARLGGEAVFLSSLSEEGKQMAINYMPNVAAVPSIKLGVTVDNSGDYELQITPQGLPVGYYIKLKDHYLNTLTSIDNEVMVYQFSVNKSDKASFGMNRFEIMLSPQTTLPVIISSFNAAKTNEGVSVKWTTSTSTNHSHFIVQRAGDNNVYTNIGSLPAQQNGVYYSLDKTPLIGNNYYRLVQVDKDGKTTTNEPIVIKYELNGAVASGILVYPTITTANYTLKYNGILSSTIYQLKISDVSGKTVFAKQLQKTAIIDVYQDVLPSVASGVYFIELVDIAKGKSLGVTKLIKK